MILISIDPGNNSGVAIFVKRELAGVALLEGNAFRQFEDLTKILNTFSSTFSSFFKAYIEIPRIYPQKDWKGDPNDLIKVALLAGGFGNVLSFYYKDPHKDVEFIQPVTGEP